MTMKLADKCDKGCIWQRVKGENSPRNRSPWSGNMFVCIRWCFKQVDISLKGVGVSFRGNQPLDVLTCAPCIHLPNCVYPILFFKGCVALFCVREGILRIRSLMRHDSSTACTKSVASTKWQEVENKERAIGMSVHMI
ncbi:unnamed protein product, partial [Discosporangium mesarthrocarpum]